MIHLSQSGFKVQLTLLSLANWIKRLMHFSITSETMQISLCATRLPSPNGPSKSSTPANGAPPPKEAPYADHQADGIFGA